MPLFVFRVARQDSSFEDRMGKSFWPWDSTIQEFQIPILQNCCPPGTPSLYFILAVFPSPSSKVIQK
ncbi:unnamed protein product [Linum trigynum]|uniref:Uncharacterized protein n=1 Tax=Linum trigynum TaxID=586398 RepID=A0AAV2G528_9ROSI